MIDKSKQPLPECQVCHKKGAKKTTVLGIPVCEDCYKKQEVTAENMFEK